MESDKARQKRFARRSRKGCITCRARRKRCDEGRPICENCIRVNVPCEYAIPQPVTIKRPSPNSQSPSSLSQSPPHRSNSPTISPPTCTPPPSLPSTASSTSTTSKTPTTTTLSPLLPQPSPNPLPTTQQHLLTHYITHLIPTISVLPTSTPYHLSLYIPLAFQSLGILNSILALSASHLSLLSPTPSHFTHLLTLHTHLSTSYLTTLIHDPEKSESNEVLAILMLLVALETQNGSVGGKWRKQLVSAGRIVASRGGPRHFIEAGWEATCIYSHFLYHDCCSMVMEGVLASSFLGSDKNSQERSGGSVVVEDLTTLCPESSLAVSLPGTPDPLMGLAGPLFSRIRRISLLGEKSGAERTRLFETLEAEIVQWVCESNTLQTVGSETSLDLIALAETYRLSALVLLYRTSQAHTTLLPNLALQIMALVARLPDGCQVESGLPFPLFMAGGELLEWRDMKVCALKLRGICERTRIMNIRGVEEVLEQVWRARLNGGRKDWVEVLREERRVICIA